MRQVFFHKGLLDTTIKNILESTNLVATFSGNLIGLETQDGEEGCVVEYYYNIDDDLNDPLAAIVSSFYIGNNLPKRLFKELENKLNFEFINKYE